MTSVACGFQRNPANFVATRLITLGSSWLPIGVRTSSTSSASSQTRAVHCCAAAVLHAVLRWLHLLAFICEDYSSRRCSAADGCTTPVSVETPLACKDPPNRS